eukprot:935904-Prymnesium_polylepis.1
MARPGGGVSARPTPDAPADEADGVPGAVEPIRPSPDPTATEAAAAAAPTIAPEPARDDRRGQRDACPIIAPAGCTGRHDRR